MKSVSMSDLSALTDAAHTGMTRGMLAADEAACGWAHSGACSALCSIKVAEDVGGIDE